MPDSLGKERKRSSRIVILAVVLVAVLMLGAVAEFMVQIGNNKERHQPETPVRVPARILYSAHSPIYITGNWGFTNASGVIWGSGTASDPYIIANWDINASSDYGIAMWYTSAYFVISNCYIHDGEANDNVGIYLTNCTNGTLSNNLCSNNYEGISLDYGSNGNTIDSNTCSNDNAGGILILISVNVTLRDNVMVNCGVVVVAESVAQSNNLDIDTSNSVNGKPVQYYKDQSGVTVPVDGGQLILANCTDSVIENQSFSNSTIGIELLFCSDITMSNDNCSADYCGMLLWRSNDNSLGNSNCSSNRQFGMYLISSCNNTLSNNTCSYNAGESGLVLDFASDGNTLCNNILSNNVAYGISIDPFSSGYSSGNRIWNNTFYHNNGAGDVYDALHIQACDDGLNNSWNSTEGFGNHWGDWTTPDANHDGIVDQPYVLNGSAGAQDSYPLTTVQTPIPEFGMMPLLVISLMAAIVVAGETRRKKKS